jgi:ABC-type Fe3+ transport system substrate-binding protein
MVLVALAACGLALAACGGCSKKSGDGEDVLVIYSPHSDEIQKEFERAFIEYYREKTGRTVTIEWPDAGGSSGVLRQLQDKHLQGIHDVDILFGGGPIHSQLKALGLLEEFRLSDDLLAKLPKTIAGEPLYDADYAWYGAAVSTFGLIYNKKVITDRGLPAVTQWMDMARPEFFGTVGAVDAAQSGSVRKAYEIMLQAYGYEKGMRLLMLMAANAREIGSSASDIPKGCSQGFIAVGPCIDFFADRQMASPGGENLGFILPEGLSSLNNDPISILKGAPHLDLAKEFVSFVMSRRGQRLWSLRAGTPGGPVETTLSRCAIVPEVYTEDAANLVEGLRNPFQATPNTWYRLDREIARINILPAYLEKMMVENKRQLTEAWKAVIDAGAPEDLVAQLTKPLVSEDELLRLADEVWKDVVLTPDMTADQKQAAEAEQDRRKKLRSDIKLQWSEGFRARYADVTAAAKARR